MVWNVRVKSIWTQKRGGGIDYAHHITTGPSRFLDDYSDKFSQIEKKNFLKKQEFPNKKKEFTQYSKKKNFLIKKKEFSNQKKRKEKENNFLLSLIDITK